MDRRGGLDRRIAFALALLPIAVVAYGLGLPFEFVANLAALDTSYYLVVAGGLGVVYALILKITQSQWARETHALRTMTDPVTGLPGLELFRDRLEQMVLLSERDGSHVPLIVMGLNRFSEINGAFGREQADEILAALADRLSEVLRDSDTVARIGGDEFAVLLPSAPDGAGAVSVVHKVRAALEDSFQVASVGVELSATFGIAVSPGHGRDAQSLIDSAESAMASAKRHGERFRMFTPDEHVMTPERVALVAELRKAIQEHQLVLFYQPKSSMNGEGIKGVEALVRWMHPEKGLIPPDLFIPLAEQTELMRPLTLYVLEEAIRQLSEWRLRGLEITVAVNVSAKNLSDEDLPHDVQKLLRTWSVPAEALELEVTESMVIDDQSRAMLILETLSDMGIKIAIDDYGAGFTSLSYLTRLPISSLKIDKSFVQKMIGERRDALVVKSTIGLGRDLDLDVVAEGVETEETWNELARLGCSQAQGYYISKPMLAADLDLN